MLPLLEAWVQSLVGELRSHKPCGVEEKKTNKLVFKGLRTIVLSSHVPCLVAQSCLFATDTLSLSMGILQAIILEPVAMPSSRGSSQPRDRTQISCISGGFFTV